jgi:arylsulfatase
MVWSNPFTALRVPKMYNLRTDPYERADITSNTYFDWMFDRAFLAIYGQAIVTQFLETFKEFPPRQEAASFTINHAVNELKNFLEKRGD